MHDRDLLVETSLTGYDAFEDLYAGFTADDWAVPSLCPDWDVRAVLTHRLSVEHMLTGWAPSAEDPPPFAKVAEFEAEVASIGNEELLERGREVWAARSEDLAAMTQATVELASFTPTGVGVYGDFLRIRIFDSWVHERDVAIPLGLETDDRGQRAEYSLDEVETALGYIVGKKIGLTEGLGITFHVTGGVTRDIHALVDGRAAKVDALADPVCEVTADVGTFVMLAAGRVDPQERIDAGAITWTGDATWGEKAARSLAYTR
jgi:uncharacterized protein (TIGR03083 family)